MIIKFYNCKSDRKSVFKTLEQEAIYNCELVDIDGLNLKLKFSDDNFNTQYNYIVASLDNTRGYFIDKIENKRGLWYITASVDVLSTICGNFKKENITIKGMLRRNNTNCNTYLSDNNFNVYAKKRVQIKSFPISFNNDGVTTYLLLTYGRGESE